MDHELPFEVVTLMDCEGGTTPTVVWNVILEDETEMDPPEGVGVGVGVGVGGGGVLPSGAILVVVK